MNEYRCRGCGCIFEPERFSGLAGTSYCSSCSSGPNESASNAYDEVKQSYLEAGYSDYDASQKAEIAARATVARKGGGGPVEVHRCGCGTLLSEDEGMCSDCRSNYERREAEKDAAREAADSKFSWYTRD